MVGVEGERATLDHVPEMADALESGEEFPIIGRPRALMGFQL